MFKLKNAPCLTPVAIPRFIFILGESVYFLKIPDYTYVDIRKYVRTTLTHNTKIKIGV